MVIKYDDWLDRQRTYDLKRLPIPNEHRGKTFADVRRHEGNALSIDMAEAWVNHASQKYLRSTSPESGKGLLFFGIPGTGKTLLASVVAQEMVKKAKRSGLVHFISMEGLNRHRLRKMDVGRLIGTAADEEGRYTTEWAEHDTEVERCYTTRLLVLDDVGQENKSDHLGRVLNELLRDRYNRGCPTIITSNVDPHEWEDHLGNASLASFIHQACLLVPVNGEDVRAGR